MASSPTKFNTYAAGVKLKPGESLHYQPGKGYYAAPRGAHGAPVNAPGAAPELVSDAASGGGYGRLPATAPGKTGAHPVAPPRPPLPPSPYGPLSPAALAAAAASQAQGAIDPQKAALIEAQQHADAQAKAQYAAIQGFNDAAGKMLQGIDYSGPYHDAASAVSGYGQAVGGQVASDLQAQQAANDAVARQEGQGSAAHGVDAEALGQTLKFTGGYVPAASLEAQGAAAEVAGQNQSAIMTSVARGQLGQALQAAKAEDDTYAAKLLDLAATFPELRNNALKELTQYELDKATYRQNVANSKADNARQDRALSDQEKAAGLDVAKAKAEFTYKYAALNFRNQQDAKKAAQAGKIIDVGASKLLGHVVYKDGSENASIKVAKSASSATNNAKAKQLVARRQTHSKIVSMVRDLRGKPETAPKKADTYVGPHGKYLADPRWPRGHLDAKGNFVGGKPGAVFPDGTTNNQKRAKYNGNRASAADTIFQAIDGADSQALYGVSPATLRTWIDQAVNREWAS